MFLIVPYVHQTCFINKLGNKSFVLANKYNDIILPIEEGESIGASKIIEICFCFVAPNNETA